MEHKQTSRLARVVKGAMIPFCIAALVGCGHLDMYDQARYDPYEPNDQIFSIERGGDGASSRPLVEDTFARGQALSSDPARSGKDTSGAYVDNPISINDNTIEHGKQRYGVYCTPCHGELGNGKGIAAGYFQTAGGPVPSFYDERLLNERDGYFFDVISNGKGLMYSYASRVKVDDRWAIVAYIRSLQADPPPGAIVPTPAPTPANGANPAATAASGSPAATEIGGANSTPTATATGGANSAPTTTAPTAAP